MLRSDYSHARRDAGRHPVNLLSSSTVQPAGVHDVEAVSRTVLSGARRSILQPADSTATCNAEQRPVRLRTMPTPARAPQKVPSAA